MNSKLLFATVALSLVGIVAACSSDADSPAGSTSSSSGGSSGSTSSGSTSSGSTSGSTSSGSTSGSTSGSVTSPLAGTINGKPFVFKSGFFFKNEDSTIDLIFTDKDGACTDAKETKIQAGETLVQFFTLGKASDGSQPAEVGTVTSEDMKYAAIASTCATGGSVEKPENVAKAGRVTGNKTINLTALTDTNVEGSLDLAFDDGSTLAGTFKLASCEVSVPDGLTCR